MNGTHKGGVSFQDGQPCLAESLSCFCAKKVFLTDEDKHLIFQGMKQCVEAVVGPDTSGGLISFLKHYCGRTDEFSPIICLSLLLSACLEGDSELCLAEIEHPRAGKSSRRAKSESSAWTAGTHLPGLRAVPKSCSLRLT